MSEYLTKERKKNDNQIEIPLICDNWYQTFLHRPGPFSINILLQFTFFFCSTNRETKSHKIYLTKIYKPPLLMKYALNTK